MADAIGSLVARITATSEGLSVELERAKGKIQSFVKDTQNIAPQGGVMNSIMTGGAMGVGMELAHAAIEQIKQAVAGLMEQFKRGDEVGDFAQKVNTSVEALTSLRYAAEQLGTSQEALDSGLTKLQTRIGEAADGSKEVADAFAKIGLSAEYLKKLDTVDAFKEVSDGIKAIPDPAMQASAAVDIFGRSGAELLNVLRAGSSEMTNFQKKAAELGITMTTAQAAVLEAANKTMQQTKMIEDMANAKMAASAAPIVQAWAQAKAAIGSAAADIVTSLGRLFTGGDGKYTIALPKTEQQREYEKYLAEMEAKEKATADAIAKGWDETAKAVQAAHDKAFKRGEDVTKAMRTPAEVAADTVSELNMLFGAGAIEADTYARAIAKAAEELDRATESKTKFDKFDRTPGIEAVVQGSVGGFSAVQSAMRLTADIERQKEKVAEAQLEEQRKTRESIERLREDIKGRGVAVMRGNI